MHINVYNTQVLLCFKPLNTVKTRASYISGVNTLALLYLGDGYTSTACFKNKPNEIHSNGGRNFLLASILVKT
jgi:hypothetical protein